MGVQMEDVLVRSERATLVSRRKLSSELPVSVSRPDNRRSGSVSEQETALRGSLSRVYSVYGKRAFDLVLVFLGAPIAIPVILFCALALWLEGGKPFYAQPRIGRSGHVFSILKLRTMVRDADALLKSHLDSDPALKAEWDAHQKLKNDPRITRVGRFLRVTSLDELPQIWNVLKGEMSLVGPRPMMPEQLTMYGNPDAYLALRPGLTGRWQVSARNESGFTARQVMDREYFTRLSLMEDVSMLRKTVGVVLRATGY